MSRKHELSKPTAAASSWTVGLVAALVLLVAASLPAQEPASETPQSSVPFFETVDVLVINVDAVVQRSDGRPAIGLRRSDFEILEDGVPVELTNFLVVQGRQGIWGDGTGELPEDFDPSQPLPETRGLSLVIFIDNLNMAPQNRNLLLDNLSDFIRTSFDSRDRFMIVSLNDEVEVAQEFTNDPELLLATIDGMRKVTGSYGRFDVQHRMLLTQLSRAELPPRPVGPLADGSFDAAEMNARKLAVEVRILAEQRHRKVRATIDIIGSFTDSLSGMRGRKGILYVSDGIPMRAADSLARSWTNKFEDWAFVQRADLQLEMSELRLMESSTEYDNSPGFKKLVDHASSNRVVFYTIAMKSRTVGNRVSAEFVGSVSTSGGGARSEDVVALESQSLDLSMMLLASGTGGIAYTRSSNIGSLLERVVQDFDMFYSLGYSPDHGADGEFHEIEVRVKRPGFKVRTMSGYREKDPISKLQDLTMSALHYDLVDNRLEVRLEPQVQVARDGGRFLVPVMVKIPFKNLLLLPQEEHHMSQVSLFVIVRDTKTGGVSPFQRIDLPIKIPNNALLQALDQVAGYALELNMKKGPKRIAIGVRDHVANSFATVNLDIQVGGG